MVNLFSRRLGRSLGWLAVFVLGLGGAGVIYQLVSAARDARRYPPPGKLVDVGGHRLHLYCTGDGSPTVVVESGGGSFSVDWGLVQPEVSGFTRICTYDRSGFGWSDVGPSREDAQHAVNELQVLLRAAEVPRPYVLVGHSLGGIYALRFAVQNREDIAGIVLVDSGHQELWSQLPEQFHRKWNAQINAVRLLAIGSRFGITRLMSSHSGVETLAGLPPDKLQIRAALTHQSRYLDAALSELTSVRDGRASTGPTEALNNVRLIVLTHGHCCDWLPRGMPNKIDDECEQAWQELQRNLASISQQGKLIIAERSGHRIMLDRPDVVISAIRGVVEAARFVSPDSSQAGTRRHPAWEIPPRRTR